jgi:hypothetical protein
VVQKIGLAAAIKKEYPEVKPDPIASGNKKKPSGRCSARGLFVILNQVMTG